MCACVCECTGLCIRIRWSVKCTDVLRAVVAEVFFYQHTNIHKHTQSDELHFKYMSLGFDLSCKIVNLMRGLKRGNRCKKTTTPLAGRFSGSGAMHFLAPSTHVFVFV